MLQLVGHFGDQQDHGLPCGLCDVCAPLLCIAQVFRDPTAQEEEARTRILAALRERGGRAVGQLHRDLFAGRPGALDRRGLEHLLGALATTGEVRVVKDEFAKGGETISFQRVYLGESRGNVMRIVVTPELKDKAPYAFKRRTRRKRGNVKTGARPPRRPKRPPKIKRA